MVNRIRLVKAPIRLKSIRRTGVTFKFCLLLDSTGRFRVVQSVVNSVPRTFAWFVLTKQQPPCRLGVRPLTVAAPVLLNF